MKKILYIYGGPEFHPTREAGELLVSLLESDGRFSLEMTSDLNKLSMLKTGQFEAVVVYTTGFHNELTPDRERELLEFVQKGGGFVGIHSAADSFKDSRAYIDMLGCEFLTHPEFGEFKVSIVNKDHYITTRMSDFTIEDEMYHLKSFNPEKVDLLCTTNWQGKQMPMAYAKEFGKGRVCYLANGHNLLSWRNPEFQKMLIRAISWSTGEEAVSEKIKCGLLGYGPSFNMGNHHSSWINATEGMEVVAVCDKDPARIDAAEKELPDLKGYFTNLDDMLVMKELDLVVIILPHHLHAPAADKCLKAKKHVVLEKPFCITTEEANRLINTAREEGLMISVFHNRRWDADFLMIKDLIQRGLIGDIFHIEARGTRYGHPGFSWRTNKKISGGVMYDWGAHYLDWILNLVPSKITQIMGDFQKRVWHSVTNEDHGQVIIRFANGVTADYMISSIAASSGPKWRILGAKGSIDSVSSDCLNLVSFTSGIRQDSRIKINDITYEAWAQYYRNIADHLLMGEELNVKPEQARRVIAVIEAAVRSLKEGVSVPPVEGCA